MTLLMVWVCYAAIGFGVFCGVFIWAVRTGQFTDLDRQRYIALHTEEPIEQHQDEALNRLDRYTVHALALLTAAVITVVLWLAYRSGGG